MIDVTKLKELMKLMADNELTELHVADEKETITLKRGSGTVIQHQPTIYGGGGGYAPSSAPAAHAPAAPAAPAPAPATAGAPAPAQPAGDSDAGLVAITSPMVGTFYASPNPDSPAFVTVGKDVTADTTVCLVEAMKVFNEIKAEKSGRIEKILVQSGAAVEYGQKLFLIKPV